MMTSQLENRNNRRSSSPLPTSVVERRRLERAARIGRRSVSTMNTTADISSPSSLLHASQQSISYRRVTPAPTSSSPVTSQPPLPPLPRVESRRRERASRASRKRATRHSVGALQQQQQVPSTPSHQVQRGYSDMHLLDNASSFRSFSSLMNSSCSSMNSSHSSMESSFRSSSALLDSSSEGSILTEVSEEAEIMKIGNTVPSDQAFNDIILDGQWNNNTSIPSQHFTVTHSQSSTMLVWKIDTYSVKYRGETIYEVSATKSCDETIGQSCTACVMEGYLQVEICNFEAEGKLESYKFPLEELARKSALERQDQLFEDSCCSSNSPNKNDSSVVGISSPRSTMML